MNERDRQLIRELTEQVGRLTQGDFAPLRLSAVPCPVIDGLVDARGFVFALSQGQLEVEPPPRNHLIASFKQLQANLRHLTWQTRQIVAGDLNQREDVPG